MSTEKKLSQEELIKLYEEILDEISNIAVTEMQNTPEGVARQKEIIEKINEHPEVLRVHTRDWSYVTIGIDAVMHQLFYVTMRALEDVEACVLKSTSGRSTYDHIKSNDNFRNRIVNSWQYKRLIERLEARLAGEEESEYDDDDLFDEDENIDKYDSIME